MCSICAVSLSCAEFATQADGAVEIGALTTLSAIEKSAYLRQHFPVLTEAAATVASPVLRNMGTLGGNICLDTRCLWYNQSLTWRKGCGFCIKKDGDLCHVAPGGTKCWAAFSGDTPPALLCLNAEIEIASPSGSRRIALQDFYTGDGSELSQSCCLTNWSLVCFLPAESADYRGIYRKLRVRGSIDYPLAGVAVAMKRSNGHVSDARIAMTAVNPAPISGAARRRDADRQSDGRSVGGSCRRSRRAHRQAADHFGAYSRISAGDDSRFHQTRRAGGGRELRMKRHMSSRV